MVDAHIHLFDGCGLFENPTDIAWFHIWVDLDLIYIAVLCCIPYTKNWLCPFRHLVTIYQHYTHIE